MLPTGKFGSRELKQPSILLLLEAVLVFYLLILRCISFVSSPGRTQGSCYACCRRITFSSTRVCFKAIPRSCSPFAQCLLPPGPLPLSSLLLPLSGSSTSLFSISCSDSLSSSWVCLPVQTTVLKSTRGRESIFSMSLKG